MPYKFHKELFYIPYETYQLMNIKAHHNIISIIPDYDCQYMVDVELSKPLIEKGMYYCSNEDAKNYMQYYIDQWIKKKVW